MWSLQRRETKGAFLRISDPRPVWIMVHQRHRGVRSGVIWIMVHQRHRGVRSFGVIRTRITQRNAPHDQSGFAGSFDAPWSRQILDHWSELGSPQRNALAGSFDAPWSRQILDHWSELGSDPKGTHPYKLTSSIDDRRKQVSKWALITSWIQNCPFHCQNVTYQYNLRCCYADKVSCNINKATRSKTKKVTFSLAAVNFVQHQSSPLKRCESIQF